jgi:hypothetical protein
MFHISIDEEQKLVEMQITGLVKADEAVRAAVELKKTFLKFGPREAVLLIDLVGFAPMSNDVLPILRGMGRDVMTFFRKAALIQEFDMQFQGARKLIEPPPGMKLPTYRTRDDAIQYLVQA